MKRRAEQMKVERRKWRRKGTAGQERKEEMEKRREEM